MESTDLSNILVVWICAGMVLLVAEALTTAFYALAMAVAAFIVAIYVAVSGETGFSVTQGGIFALASILFAIFFPRWFQRSVPDKKQGMELYVGKNYTLKIVYGHYKIEIDGVDYLVDESSVTPDFAEGKGVRLDSVEGGVFRVSLV